MSFQQVTLNGFVTKQGAESRFTSGGQQVTNFTISTVNTLSKVTAEGKQRPCPEGWAESKNGKAWEARTYWRVTVWGRLAEYANEAVKPGDFCFVQGEMKGSVVDGVASPRVWSGKDGIQHADYEVTASVLKVVTPERQAAPATAAETEEIPF